MIYLASEIERKATPKATQDRGPNSMKICALMRLQEFCIEASFISNWCTINVKKMKIESRSTNKRRRFADEFNEASLALLSASQRSLLKQWLKANASTRSWQILLGIAGSDRIEIAESLLEALLTCGGVLVEEHFKHATWQPVKIVWRDYERLCSTLGMTTRAARDVSFGQAWTVAASTSWQTADLNATFLALENMTAHRAHGRLELLLNVNDWLVSGKSGTRRDFSLFAHGETKYQISDSEWNWLDDKIDLPACGIQRHAPLLYIAGDLQLNLSGRWLDIGSTSDFIGLGLPALSKLSNATSPASHYRLIENLTSFEHVVRNMAAQSSEIVIWLPGYASTSWKSAVNQLLSKLPRPARISCDADPHGVQIALIASRLWSDLNLTWEPYAMSVEHAKDSANKLNFSDHDNTLALSLLKHPDLPDVFLRLLQWCIDNRLKAEQENWIR